MGLRRGETCLTGQHLGQRVNEIIVRCVVNSAALIDAVNSLNKTIFSGSFPGNVYSPTRFFANSDKIPLGY